MTYMYLFTGHLEHKMKIISSRVESTCMTTSFHSEGNFWLIKLV